MLPYLPNVCHLVGWSTAGACVYLDGPFANVNQGTMRMNNMPPGQIIHWRVSKLMLVNGKDQTEALKNASAGRIISTRRADGIDILARVAAQRMSVGESTDADLVTRADSTEDPHRTFPLHHDLHALGKSKGQGRRSGGMVMGAMSSAPATTKVMNVEKSFHVAGKDADEVRGLSHGMFLHYHRGRAAGMTHGKAAAYAYAKDDNQSHDAVVRAVGLNESRASYHGEVALIESRTVLTALTGDDDKDYEPPTAGDISKVDAAVNNKNMPDTADDGKAYVVHWANGRGIFAVKRKAQLPPWLKSVGSWAEIVSIKHTEPVSGGKKLRVMEANLYEGDYIDGWDRHFTESELRNMFDKVKLPTYVIDYESWKARHFRRNGVSESIMEGDGSAPYTEDMARSRESAWWVHPNTGEVLAVHRHALTVAEKPEKFGLSHSDVARAGGGKNFNYVDNAKDSPRHKLIDAATKNGWIRVRSLQGGAVGSGFQTHGHSHEVAAAVEHLEKRGHVFRGAVHVEDTAAGTNKTYASVGALKKAHLKGEMGSGDAATRSTLRARLAPHFGAEHEPTFSAYERKVGEDTTRQHGDDPVRGAPTMTATLTSPLDTDAAGSIDKTMGQRIARRMQTNRAGKDKVTKLPDATTPPLANDNDMPNIRQSDPTPALQSPTDLR